MLLRGQAAEHHFVPFESLDHFRRAAINSALFQILQSIAVHAAQPHFVLYDDFELNLIQGGQLGHLVNEQVRAALAYLARLKEGNAAKVPRASS